MDKIMANITKDGNHTTTSPEFFCTSGLGAAQTIFVSTISLPLSIVAIIGNFLIIVTLRKVSCLRPPSKLLLGCLTCTDLGVGLISFPLHSGYHMSPENSKSCQYSRILFSTIGSIFCAVSLLTITGISVDRLLVLLLELRYNQVVTARRVKTIVVTFWVFSTCIAAIVFYSLRAAVGIACALLLLCMMISTFCYTKIYRTLRLSQAHVQDQGHKIQPSTEGTQLNKARYKKTVFSALWIQMTLFACYLPFCFVVGFISISAWNTSLFNFAWALTLTLLLSNSTLNPFLYCWRIREMKQAVKQRIRQFFCFPNEET